MYFQYRKRLFEQSSNHVNIHRKICLSRFSHYANNSGCFGYFNLCIASVLYPCIVDLISFQIYLLNQRITVHINEWLKTSFKLNGQRLNIVILLGILVRDMAKRVIPGVYGSKMNDRRDLWEFEHGSDAQQSIILPYPDIVAELQAWFAWCENMWID
jgi:hypothetical protein